MNFIIGMLLGLCLLFLINFLFSLYLGLKIKYRRYKADVEYVKKADAKILGKGFEEILPHCDKNMIRILKLMNRKERREWLKANSGKLKKLKNG